MKNQLRSTLLGMAFVMVVFVLTACERGKPTTPQQGKSEVTSTIVPEIQSTIPQQEQQQQKEQEQQPSTIEQSFQWNEDTLLKELVGVWELNSSWETPIEPPRIIFVYDAVFSSDIRVAILPNDPWADIFQISSLELSDDNRIIIGNIELLPVEILTDTLFTMYDGTDRIEYTSIQGIISYAIEQLKVAIGTKSYMVNGLFFIVMNTLLHIILLNYRKTELLQLNQLLKD